LRSGNCIRFEQTALTNPAAGEANHRQRFGFCFAGFLARFVQETDRSVSYSREKT
jgi:hypothetical protein